MPSLWKQKNSPYWYINFVDPTTGKRVRRSTGIEDRRTVELVLKDIELKIARGQYAFEELTPSIKMRKFINEYIQTYSTVNKSPGTCRIDALSLKRWIEFVGNIQISDVTVKLIEQYKQERLQHIKPVSLNIELRSLKAAFQVAVKWRYLKNNPFKEIAQLKINEPRTPQFLAVNEIRRLLSVIDNEKFKLLVEMYLSTGGRRNEVLSLTIDDIDIPSRTVTFVNGTKFGKKRVVPLNQRALKILTHLRKSTHASTDRIFEYEKNYISRRFKYYARKAGLPESIKTHSLRHTFASALAERSVDIHTIKQLLGHSSVKVTEIYSHLSPEHKIKAVNKLTY